jgi:hypothetical protein
MKKRNKAAAIHKANWIMALFFLLALFCTSGEKAKAQVTLMPNPHMQFFDSSGAPLASGCVFTYAAGTTTPLATFTDSSGLFQNRNPVILDGGGFATIYLSTATYKIAVFKAGGVNCASGAQVWMQDNVTASQFLSLPFIQFVGQSTEPPNSPGELYYNTAFQRLRFSNGNWDTIPTDNSIDTLTNKKLTQGTNTFHCQTDTLGFYFRDDGTQLSCSAIQPQDVLGSSVSIPNCSVTGTVAFAPAILSNAAGSVCAVVAPAATTSGIIGFCFNNCGTTGQGIILQQGQSNCLFDNATTAGDYVQLSNTANGQCHDAGTSPPIGVQTLGRVSQSVPLGNSAIVTLGILGSISQSGVVFSTAPAATTVAIGSTLIAVPLVTATFRISLYATQSALGASCASNPTVNAFVTFQDPNAAAPQTVQFGSWLITGNGTVGTIPIASGGTQGSLTFRSKAGVAMQYSTTYTSLTSCSPNPTYQIFPILEQLTRN